MYIYIQAHHYNPIIIAANVTKTLSYQINLIVAVSRSEAVICASEVQAVMGFNRKICF